MSTFLEMAEQWIRENLSATEDLRPAGSIMVGLAVHPNIPPDDPAAWREPFAEWLQSACVCHWRVSGGVGVLHRAYSAWESQRDGVPCKRETFETLLWERGFTLRAFPGGLLADGLALWPDAERLREMRLLH
ncbi:MAG: hypothetical protein WA374_06070 [Acidobacteriaceae bacterium]